MDTEVRISSKDGYGCTETTRQELPRQEASTANNMGANGQATAGGRQGEFWFTEADERLEEENANVGIELAEKRLTPRQREILGVFRQEKTQPKTAARLDMSIGSVKDQMKEIRNRLGVKSCAELLPDCDVPNGLLTDETVTGARLLELIEDQQYRCALSGVELEPDTAVLDHKTPRNRGGRHELSNVWFLHRDVNRAKGTMTVDEFRLMCSRVAQWGA
jgi:DNA-binding CsgD family transcriptional regulator